MDSHLDPLQKGTLDEFDDILAALLNDAFTRESVLGKTGMTLPVLFKYIVKVMREPFANRFRNPSQRNFGVDLKVTF